MKKFFTNAAIVCLGIHIAGNLLFDFFPAVFLSLAVVSGIIALVCNVLGIEDDSKKKKNNKTTHTNTTQNKKLNDEVKQYFSQVATYPLGNGIYLEYANIDQFDALNVLCNGEVICKVGEFRQFNAQTYEAIRISFERGITGTVEKNTTETPNVVNQEVKPTKSELENYMEVLTSYTNALDNQDVVSGLTTTTSMLKTIDIVIKKTPAKEAKLDKLKSFYLPSLVSILKNYDYLCETNKNDPDFPKVEAKLISTINLINEALQSMLESLNDDEILDINSDMSVIESMLQQDGLVKKGSLDELK